MLAGRVSRRQETREDILDKICSIAILLALILAIVAAFIDIPSLTAALLILGAVGGINTADKPEYRVRVYGAAIVLMLGAHMLREIPAIGERLEEVFTNLSVMFVGLSVVAITLAIAVQVRANLLK
jgi:hypothetical protein